MSLSYVASGAWAFAASTSGTATPALPTGWAQNDLLILTVHYKQSSAAFPTPAGWTALTPTQQGGTGTTYAAGAGDVVARHFVKQAGASESAPTVGALTGGSTNTTTGNVFGCQISAWRSTSGIYNLAYLMGGVNSSTTAWSVGGATSLAAGASASFLSNTSDIAVNDFFEGYGGMSLSTTTQSAHAFTRTGATFSAVTVAPTKGASTIGADLGCTRWQAQLTAGPGSGVLTLSATQSAATYGPMSLLRIREGAVAVQSVSPTGIAGLDIPGGGSIAKTASTATTALGVDGTITSLACNTPTGLTPGNTLIASVAAGGAITPPAGWTLAKDQASTANLASAGLYYRVVTGTEAATYTWTAGAAGRMSIWMQEYSGIDTTTPQDATATGVGTANGAGASTVIPSLTTVTDGALVMSALAQNASSSTLTKPTEQTLDQALGNPGKTFGVASETKATAGATGTRTWASSGTTDTAGVMVAWRPAAGAGSSPVGQPTISQVIPATTVSPGAVTSAEAFGTSVISQTIPGQLAITGIPSAEAFGAPTVTGGGGGGPVGTVTSAWVGAPTTDGATVACKVTAGTNVRLKVSTASDLSVSPVFGSYVTPDVSTLVCKPKITGLTAATTYYYGIEIGGTVDATKIGRFHTAKTGQANFSFSVGSCANADSTCFTLAKNRDPDFGLITGDIAYFDISTNSPSSFRSGFDSMLARTNQHDYLRNVATPYIWSDHDFGANNATGSSASKSAAQSVYRERVPHYPLETSAEIYHSFTYGRVLFLMTDERSNKSDNTATDNSSKTMLGAIQKQWFKDQITNSMAPLIIWVGDSTWIGAAASPDDDWFAYDTERQELATFIASSGKNILRLQGDMHALAADDGTNAPGGIGVFSAAPWNNAISTKGGPYTVGPYTGSTTMYGYVDITDTGSSISALFRGFDETNTQRVTLTKTYTLASNQTTSPSAISSSEAFGTPTRTSSLTVSPSAITTVEASGVPVVNTSGTISPVAISPGEAFGTPMAATLVTVSPSAITSIEAFGSPTRSSSISLSPSAISSLEAFGVPVGSTVVTVSPTGIVTAQALGIPVVSTGAIILSPAAIASLEAFGTAVITRIVTVSPTGLASAEAFGVPVITRTVTVSPSSVASAQAVGTPSASALVVVSPTAITSQEDVRLPAISGGGVTAYFTGWGIPL